MSLKSLVRPLACVVALAFAGSASAEPPPPQYVQFKPSATKGALYLPDPAQFPDAHVAVIVMHRNSNYLSHITTKELPKRSFIVLAMNPRCDNNEAACAPWENNALDVKQGVDYARALPGVTKVLLYGHSGGGPTMSFYQAVAEAGEGFCKQEQKLVQCDKGFDALPGADGLILMDAHPGNGINSLRSIDGAVTNDADILAHNAEPKIDPALDPFAAGNGYSPEGSTYSPEFIAAYTEAQARRMDRLIDLATTRLAEAEARGDEDGAFIVPLMDGARLPDGDVSIFPATLKPRKLLKDDGTVVEDAVVKSVRVPVMDGEEAQSFESTSFLTLRSFLSVRAIRGTNSFDGIDWCSSNNSTVCNIAEVHVPLLVTAMGGHYFVQDNEQIFEAAASTDKDFVVIEGATHGGTPCERCEKTPGQYANATKNLFDYVADWINARY